MRKGKFEHRYACMQKQNRREGNKKKKKNLNNTAFIKCKTHPNREGENRTLRCDENIIFMQRQVKIYETRQRVELWVYMCVCVCVWQMQK